MAQVSQIKTPNGISWHVEQAGSGPHILFIPSGEGDCHCFGKISSLLAPSFTVTTFDMPGFSRSPCEPSALENLTPKIVATQIISLMDALKIPTATVYGSSSGGVVAFAMLSAYESRVDRIIIHEVPFHTMPALKAWISLPESEYPKIIAQCKKIFAHHMNEDQAAWEGLGEDYHKRLESNFITWIHKYPAMVDSIEWDLEGLKKNREKVFWSVGKLMPMGSFVDNVILATQLGIKLELLDSMHFPQVSIPGVLAEYIQKSCD